MTREQLEALKVDLSDSVNWAPTTRVLVLQMFEEYTSQRALIEQQAKEIAKLREALQPFAQRAEFFDKVLMANGGSWPDDHSYADEPDPGVKDSIYIGELRKAKQALKEEHS